MTRHGGLLDPDRYQMKDLKRRVSELEKQSKSYRRLINRLVSAIADLQIQTAQVMAQVPSEAQAEDVQRGCANCGSDHSMTCE